MDTTDAALDAIAALDAALNALDARADARR